MYHFQSALQRRTANIVIVGQTKNIIIPHKMYKIIMQIFVVFLCISLMHCRPAEDNGSKEVNFQREERSECIKINNLKKNVYEYLESKLANLNRAQQELLAKKLISKLHRHFSSRRIQDNARGPWINNGDMFARMLK